MSEVNIPLLRKAVEWVEVEAAKPVATREWDQSWWMLDPQDREEEHGHPCGTSYCVAGWVAMSTSPRRLNRNFGNAAALAREALGLTFGECNADPGSLFWGGNTAEDVRRIAEQIAGERL